MRATMLAIAVTLAVLATLGAAAWAVMIRMPGEAHRGALPPLSQAEVQARQRLENDVRFLAGTIGERNVFHPGSLERAAQHVEKTLRDLGYAVESQSWDSHGETVRNVEATLRGTDRPQEIVLIGGHYDSVMGTVGANDNATGAAAVLEVARQLAGRPQPRTLRFVAFVNEEPPHFNVGEMGSQYYARAAARRGDTIVAMLSLETLGCYSDEPGSQLYPFPFSLFYPDRGNFVAFVGNIGSRKLVRHALGAFRASARFPSEGVAAPAFIPGVAWSDHGSFWPHGYRAIMVTDTAPYRDPRYHTPDDTPEHVDFARLSRVVSGLTRATEALAQDSG